MRKGGNPEGEKPREEEEVVSDDDVPLECDSDDESFPTVLFDKRGEEKVEKSLEKRHYYQTV